MTDLFAHTSGPRSAKIVIVGEAFGEAEEASGLPFAGTSGKELFFMLGDAWPEIDPTTHANIKRVAIRDMANKTNYWLVMRDQWLEAAGLLLTNVLNLRPLANKLETLCASKLLVGPSYPMPALLRGQYLRPEFLGEVDRLRNQLLEVRPNIVIACGNTATWALLRVTNIGSIRGTAAEADLGGGQRVKVLPTYHPAGVLRQWSWRPIVITDFKKALAEAEFKEIRRPERELIVSPSLEDISKWMQANANAELISCDIETTRGQISMIGFATSARRALVIPFIKDDFSSYWPEFMMEAAAWRMVREILLWPGAKLFQNGMYDLQYIWKMGFRVTNARHDTMLLHHSLYPEVQKGLGFLGSIYTQEPAWKLMRREETTKRDE